MKLQLRIFEIPSIKIGLLTFSIQFQWYNILKYIYNSCYSTLHVLFFLKDSNHITLWKRNEKYDDKIFGTEEPLHAMSAISCGRLCSNLPKSSAFSYQNNGCYCYDSKPTNSQPVTILRGAEFYSKEPIAKSIGKWS